MKPYLLRVSLLVGVISAFLVSPAWADNFDVTNTNNSGPGSLRQAILDANANGGLDRINFDIPGAGPHTISPSSPLPSVNGQVVINGYTEPGSRENTLSTQSNAIILIELDGSNAGSGADGLVINAGDSAVRGLAINNFSGDGIELTKLDNVVAGNHIGTDPTGEQAQGNGGAGVRISNAPKNLVGGSEPESRNVISGNGDGIVISGGSSTDTRVLGNYVGTNKRGTRDLGNRKVGMLINQAPGNGVGSGDQEPLSNLISGNGEEGVKITGVAADDNQVANNRIGTDVSGTRDLGNARAGVSVEDGSDNTVGGLLAVSANLISGNDGSGAVVSGNSARDNRVVANFVGTDRAGTEDLGNSKNGVFVSGAVGTLVGDGEPEAGNVISGNEGSGIVVSGNSATRNRIWNNQVGTDKNSKKNLGNSLDGIALISGARENFVGGLGSPDQRRNVVAFNDRAGMLVSTNSTSNAILSNPTFSNAKLGIDLGGDGVTGNDNKDPDSGPNKLQNYPVLTSAKISNSGSTTIKGKFNSTPNQRRFIIQFFSSPKADPSGFGEGKKFLGGDFVNTDAQGNATFSFTLKGAKAGEFVSATATTFGEQGAGTIVGNTSEFSKAVKVSG